MMWKIQQYHPAEAEAQACFELKLATVMETYFRALRERIVSLVDRDGALPVTFWMGERDAVTLLLAPLYEAGVRLGLELEGNPRAAFNALVNMNHELQAAIEDLTDDVAHDITISAAQRVNDMLHMGVNTHGLPDRLRDELRTGILSDSRADQLAGDEAGRILAAGMRLADRAGKPERFEVLEYEANRLCV